MARRRSARSNMGDKGMKRENRRFLVVGGGVGGMSAALSLRKQGTQVELIDIDPEWRVLGAGITITGPTLRAFHRLGVLQDVANKGFLSEQVKFYSCDGTFLHAMETRALEPGLPPAGGIMRPDLHNIFSSQVRAAGVAVRLGIAVQALEENATGVNVTFSDGSQRRYDGVIGADGFQSALRRLILPDAVEPHFTGQGCWRMIAPRPADLTGAEIYFGPGYKVGINPCSPDYSYLFVTMSMPGNPFIPREELEDRLRDILAPIGGRIPEIRARIGSESNVNYRPLEGLLLPPPWHVGRVGLIGDAIHATTPHLASGAGLAVEDGLLLGEYLAGAEDLNAAWTAFETRRWSRVQLVVENSFLICRWEQEGGHEQDVARLMGESTAQLAQPM